MNKTKIEELLECILKEADTREYNACAGGESHDGGARALRDQVSCYRHGMAGTVPPTWSSILDIYFKEKEAEYQDYLRLKQKFEGNL